MVTKEFGGDDDVPIGTASTAPSGAASITYKPTWTGKEQFVAKLTAGASGADAATATSYYRVTTSAPGPLYATANPQRPLSFIGHIFVGTVLAIVALLWLTLIVILLLMARRLPRLAGGGKGPQGVLQAGQGVSIPTHNTSSSGPTADRRFDKAAGSADTRRDALDARDLPGAQGLTERAGGGEAASPRVAR